MLEAVDPDRTLYLAVPLFAYQSFFDRALPKAAIREYGVKLMIYDPRTEVITQSIN